MVLRIQLRLEEVEGDIDPHKRLFPLHLHLHDMWNEVDRRLDQFMLLDLIEQCIIHDTHVASLEAHLATI